MPDARVESPPGVIGIGGAFLFSNDAPTLAAWYERHLGIGPLLHNDSEACHYFEFTRPDPATPDGVVRTTWAVFQSKDPLPPGRSFMLNYRVSDLAALLDRLRGLAVEVERTQDENYGRFAWIRDPDGNRIELYQQLP